jgi:hypothetical protein
MDQGAVPVVYASSVETLKRWFVQESVGKEKSVKWSEREWTKGGGSGWPQ